MPTQIRFNLEDFDMEAGDEGACIKCGAHANGVEPDARGYECEECGSHSVYGAEELLIMGLVD